MGISLVSSEMGGAVDGAGLAGAADGAGSLGLADSIGLAGSTGFADSEGTTGCGFTAEPAGLAVLLVAAGPPLSGEEEHPAARASTPARIGTDQPNERETSGMSGLLRGKDGLRSFQNGI